MARMSYILRQFDCVKTATHPTTNRLQSIQCSKKSVQQLKKCKKSRFWILKKNVTLQNVQSLRPLDQFDVTE